MKMPQVSNHKIQMTAFKATKHSFFLKEQSIPSLTPTQPPFPISGKFFLFTKSQEKFIHKITTIFLDSIKVKHVKVYPAINNSTTRNCKQKHLITPLSTLKKKDHVKGIKHYALNKPNCNHDLNQVYCLFEHHPLNE